MNDNKSRDIFYGVVAVATLIVALVGATLAYFSISVNSSEGAVNAQATTVSIEYNDGQQVTAQAEQLIPATLDVVKKVYEKNRTEGTFGAEGSMNSNLCTDDNDREVCSIYRFTVRSDVERKISATLNNEYNGFTYLAYAVRDANCAATDTDSCWLNLDTTVGKKTEYIGLTQCDNLEQTLTNERGEAVGECYVKEGTKKTYNITPNAINSIFGYEAATEGAGLKMTNMTVGATTQAYDLVLFINENNDNQNIDQGQKYSGTLIVEVTDAGTNGQITGTVKD